ncbi:hypothetical protein FO519_001579 [Halicephalobus sp. NKZ332]|nr:hypothetical protein FO519_001579 [Halicephalobus sp. NKZ332]
MIPEDRILANITTILVIVYSIPTYVLYVVMVYAIFFSTRKNDFSTSFYKLILPESGFFLTFALVICYHCGAATPIIDLFISFNRFTVIFLNVKYHEFWRKMMPWVYGIVLVVPNFFTWHLWLTDVRNELVNASDPDQGYYWDQYATENVPWMQNSRNTMITFFICAIPSFLMNLYICCYLLKRKFSKMNSNNAYSDTQNVRLFVYTILIFITQVCLGCIQLILTVSTDWVLLEYVYSYMLYMFDVVALTPAWFLFVMNKSLRDAIFQMGVFKKILNKKSSTIVIVASLHSETNTISNINQSISRTKSLPEIGFFMTFIPVICYHCGVAVSLIDFFISLNRFTVILMKVNHKEFWRKIMPWIYVIVLILPNLFTWHFWLTDIRNEMYNASDPDQGYYWDQYATENVPWMQNSRNMSIVIFGCAFPSCCMNFYVCFHLIKQKLSKTYSTSTYSEKQNVQLLIYTLLIFITEIGLGFVMLSFTVSTDAVFLEYVYSYMHYMFDIVSLAPAWFLFIVDGMIRTAIFQICVSKNISNTAIPAGIITSSVQSNVNVNNNMNMELPVIP